MEGEPVDKGRYQRLVGRFIYLSHTRPDIAHAINLMIQYMHDPFSSHIEVEFRVLGYLKIVLGNGIQFSPSNNMRIDTYTDADWVDSLDGRHSTSRYCAFVDDNLVTWHSKKQVVVSRSSAKVEFSCNGL
ncbi:uncharacterized mitochondrial protein AtMg00810-like [Macadamia integrifolia]|uniref:uncharacterized mitochondrial protein AtMg00810-like n=1 Tax=Macadamia integrifolia TaxID=60698 RepID=UPI001C50272C|nr:uncharacterized mitochondrial protein AtMg00810-like [Macadamia integrifolia]